MTLKIFEKIVKPLEEVEKYVESILSHTLFPKIDINFIKGKRLRPALVFFTSESYDKEDENVCKLASSVEFVHFASLIHDDVIDGAETRREVPALNKLYGNRSAVLVGDYIFSIAIEQVSSIGNSFLFQVLSSTVKEMCDGEMMEEFLSREMLFSEENYYQLILKKTASLFRCASLFGAIYKGEKNIMPYKIFGENLGMIYQILDDCADILDERNNDIIQGKVTLPLIITSPFIIREFPEFIYKKDEVDFSRIREIVLQEKGIEKSKERTNFFYAKAEKQLNNFKNPLRNYLKDYLNEIMFLGENIFKKGVFL